MNLEDLRGMDDRQILAAVLAVSKDRIMPDVYRVAFNVEIIGDLAMLLEEKLRERYPKMQIQYGTRRTTVVLEPLPTDYYTPTQVLEWPATVDPRRVRCEAFLLAFGGAS